jgi:hypothetical protein
LVAVPSKHYPETDVDGRNRYRYFRRPIIPFLPQLPPNVVLAPTRYAYLDTYYTCTCSYTSNFIVSHKPFAIFMYMY